jgi:hypothetical protein
MKRSPAGVLFCLLGLLIAVVSAGCGGTETGNPVGTGGAGGRTNPAIDLGEEICAILTFCLGEKKDFTEEDCEWAIADSETLGSALGVLDEPPPGYGEVIDKVENSELTANEEAVAECLEAIRSLECDDEEVLAVNTDEGFTNVEEMVPEEFCSEVFSVPQGNAE